MMINNELEEVLIALISKKCNIAEICEKDKGVKDILSSLESIEPDRFVGNYHRSIFFSEDSFIKEIRLKIRPVERKENTIYFTTDFSYTKLTNDKLNMCLVEVFYPPLQISSRPMKEMFLRLIFTLKQVHIYLLKYKEKLQNINYFWYPSYNDLTEVMYNCENWLMREIYKVMQLVGNNNVTTEIESLNRFLSASNTICSLDIMEYLPFTDIYNTLSSTKLLMENILNSLNGLAKDYIDGELYNTFGGQYKKEECTQALLLYLIYRIPEIQNIIFNNTEKIIRTHD